MCVTMDSCTRQPEDHTPCAPLRSAADGEAARSSTTDDAAPRPVLRYKLVIAYDGTDFHGWQKQIPPDAPPLRTVAGEVEATLARLLGQPVNLLGASRTDAGVHARGQVAQFDASLRIPIERLAEAVNSRLPQDIEVVSAEVADANFDAISGCRSKQYRYRIFNTRRRPLDRRHYAWHCWTPLDVDRMNQAAARLVGTHDFAGFAAAGHGRLSTVRTITACRVERPDPDGPEVHIFVEGAGFLYNMVRIIAGTLVEIGRGHSDADMIDRAIETADRSQAGPTLPPQGLWLEWIEY